MVELTRRWFVFGSAAAIAATQIPVVIPDIVNPIIVPMPARHVFLRRHLIELMASFDYNKGVGDEVGSIRIIGPRGDNHMHIQINTKAIYRWIAPVDEAEGIIIKPDQSFSFVAEAQTAIGHLQAIFMDYVDDGPPVYVSESFPSGETAPLFLHANNSREARDKRWQEMKEAAKRGWVNEGLCDKDFDVDTPRGPIA